MLTDTHTHPYLPEFENPRQTVTDAIAAGIGHMILPAVDISSIEPMLELHRRFPRETSLAFGLHPTETGNDYADVIKRMKQIAVQNHPVAIGEIGIDLYWDTSNREVQRKAFAMQVEWALEWDLPIIIHCREGLDDTLEILQNAPAVPRGVMHSFGGTPADVERIRRTGDFYFGINGIVTFKNSKLRESLHAIGTDRLLLETDAPYLAPVPMRGRRCEPSYLVHTARYMADYLSMTPEELAKITSENAKRLFRLDYQM